MTKGSSFVGILLMCA